MRSFIDFFRDINFKTRVTEAIRSDVKKLSEDYRGQTVSGLGLWLMWETGHEFWTLSLLLKNELGDDDFHNLYNCGAWEEFDLSVTEFSAKIQSELCTEVKKYGDSLDIFLDFVERIKLELGEVLIELEEEIKGQFDTDEDFLLSVAADEDAGGAMVKQRMNYIRTGRLVSQEVVDLMDEIKDIGGLWGFRHNRWDCWNLLGAEMTYNSSLPLWFKKSEIEAWLKKTIWESNEVRQFDFKDLLNRRDIKAAKDSASRDCVGADFAWIQLRDADKVLYELPWEALAQAIEKLQS